MSVNIANLELAIAKKMAAAISTEDALIYTKAIEQLKNGSVNVVNDITGLPAITVAGVGELYFVKSDKQVYFSDGSFWRKIGDPVTKWALSWGRNTTGQIGDNTFNNTSVPVNVSTKLTGWKSIDAGYRTTFGIDSKNTLWAWGYNNCGRLGDGTVTNRSSPVSVVGGFTDWCQVSNFSSHSVAIRTNGTLWSWGLGTYGRLGDDTIVAKSSPVSVVGGFTDWCQASAGGGFTIAIRTNGSAWSWGSAAFGTLGDGTTVSKSSPVSVVGGFTDWCQVSAGSSHSIAVRTNGTSWAWGSNSNGRLGDGTSVSKTSPVSVVGGFTDWCQVSAGSQHSAAVRTNGTLWAWGTNSYGQIGDDSIVNKSSPVSVVGGFTDWCQVSAGNSLTVAVRTTGTAWAWGINSWSQLGDGTNISRSSPVSVAGGNTTWIMVSTATDHSVGIVNKVI